MNTDRLTVNCVSKISRLKFFFILLLSCLSTECFPQIIRCGINDHELPEPQFSAEFIRGNKIKIIRAYVASKPDHQAVQDEGNIRYYEFDTLGNMIRHYYTRVKTSEEKEVYHPAVYKKGKKIFPAKTVYEKVFSYDTIHYFFFYDSSNRLLLKRKGQDNVFMSHYFEYSQDGNIAKDMFCRETNVSGRGDEFRLGMQSIISVETFGYEKQSENQWRRKCMNDQGRVYKEAIILYDEKGRKAEEDYRFSVSWVSIKNSFSYDRLGRLSSKGHRSNTGGLMEEFTRYEYDGNGNLLTEKFYRNDKQLTEKSYLYDEQGKFLKSQVERVFEKKIIEIIKYAYEFHSGSAQPVTLPPPVKSFR